ncbi:uncharacterized protein LY89DRAFT_664914 [Mollisia scopiformis]|uniref:Acyltransferase 3 domain-containing protein n=1 Tax=Mollisia scopiformis TaxID=149040 RepID=A0A194XNL4_MOLSC|nr:uncharacterized protein LY89DRAFT_664914 [Mollisia scopiformis]KUJ21746.1 hypothetical protein LY89DRAFT_664914 [Mollisia scopiformis]
MTPRKLCSYTRTCTKYATNALMPNYFHQVAAQEARHRDKPGKRFGYGYDHENNWLFQLPIVRLYSGVPMVAIFFMISGYALALKPLSHIRSGSWDQLTDSIGSAIFRRGIRLFLPAFVTTFLVMISIRLRLQDFPGYSILPGVIEPRPRHFAGHYEQLLNWCHFFVAELTNPWDWKVHDYAYDSHLWTLPIEFRASMILFLFPICISRFQLLFRSVLASALWIYCMYCDKWHVALFISGMCFADISLETRPSLQNRTSYKHLVYILPLLILGLHLLSFPIRHSGETMGYIWLSSITAKYTNWHTIGATLVLWSLNSSEVLENMFTSSFSGYLGKISYALYHVHGSALHTFEYGTVSFIWTVIGKETRIKYEGGLILGFLLVAPVVFWWADVFERLVDRPSVEVARWLYVRVFLADWKLLIGSQMSAGWHAGSTRKSNTFARWYKRATPRVHSQRTSLKIEVN